MEFARIAYPRNGADTANSAMDELFDLFPDHYPKLVYEDSENWILELNWPAVLEWYVDRAVFTESKSLLGLNPLEIPTFYQERVVGQNINLVFSMFHSRAIIAAARANKRLGYALKTIVHIDDHDDLMPTQLFPDGDSISNHFNLVEGLRFDDYDSIVKAIDNGCINMGNFLTTYLLFNYPGNLFVVNPKKEVKCGWLHSELVESPFAKGTVLQKGLFVNDQKVANAWRYERTPRIPTSIPGGNDEKIWLDIDLDVFCNRYERDSVLSEEQGNLEEKQEMGKKVKNVFSELKEAQWLPRVEAVSLSVSPGFFPSDYWGEVLPDILSRITALFEIPK